MKTSKPEDDIVASIPDAGVSELVKYLNKRFSKDEVYSRIGQKILVTVNPNKPLENSSDKSMKSICSAVKDGQPREPHMFELASNCYYEMAGSRTNQSILFL